MPKTFEEMAEDLKGHEDVATMTIGGKDYSWLLCRRGLRIARDKGLDVDGLFATMNDARTDGARRIGSLMDSVGDLLVVGLLPFYEDAEDIVDKLSVQDMGRITPQIKTAFQKVQAEAEAGKAEAQGEADRKKGRR
jgi:hypothetical protein